MKKKLKQLRQLKQPRLQTQLRLRRLQTRLRQQVILILLQQFLYIPVRMAPEQEAHSLS